MSRIATNERFGRLVTVSPRSRGAGKTLLWTCKCDCGATAEVSGDSLRQGKTNSCGCLRVELGAKLGAASKTHGMGSHPVYNTYKAMLRRCYIETTKSYQHYGGRGIEVCDRWRGSFEAFCQDMLPQWKQGLQIERVDNDRNYTPENCVWATRSEQNRNRRPFKRRD